MRDRERPKKWFSKRSARICALFLLNGLLPFVSFAQSYTIRIHAVEDIQNIRELQEIIQVPQKPQEASAAFSFVQSIVPGLQEKGYLAASVDSINITDSLYEVFVYRGLRYQWAQIRTDSLPAGVFTQAGISQPEWSGRPLRPSQMAGLSERLLSWAENNGYPFARLWLDELMVDSTGGVRAQLRMDYGPLHRFDSIVIHSDVRVSRNFLLRHLDLKQGERYSEKKLHALSNRIREITFLQEAQPWELEFSFGRAVLHLYLKERKANQLNALVGLIPNSLETGKFLLTVDALFAFRNLLGQGEAIHVTYQNLQYRSPRFRASFVYPYLLQTAFGVDAQFDLFKKDTAFRRTSFQGGLRYQINTSDYVRVYYQHQSNRLITVDTGYVRRNKRLPEDVDVTANGAGVELGINRTDYRLNPRRGFEGSISTSALIRQIRRSEAVTGLADNSGFDYAALYDTLLDRQNQYVVQGQAAVYFPLSGKLVFRPAYYGGWIGGASLFRNELYQIGGFRLLRGFDEQSIFTNQYHVLSAELRVILNQNSWFYIFSDNGWVQTAFSVFSKEDWYNGFGVGATLETGSGIFTISYALGRNSENPIQFRQSRVHFGYVAYF